MAQPQTPSLIERLRATMQEVEQTAGVPADDPSLLELRTILDRRVADLQLAMASEFSHAASEPGSCGATEFCDCEMAAPGTGPGL